jgi:hypothetical protein
MKKYILILACISFALSFTSCDKVENPIKPAIELDTTIYEGIWEDYVYPTFSQNTNTERNVLLEDYTGHRCLACPGAAVIAKDIEDANPDRVFVASVHASPGGITVFQELAADCGLPSNPTDKYCTTFYCNEGIEYGNVFGSGFGFTGNPSGNVNRKDFGSNVFTAASEWTTNTAALIAENDLKVNIQAECNYYASANGFYLHTETEFLEDLTGSYNMVVYLMENEVVDYQDVLGTAVPDYHHHNIFRGCIDGLPWGRSISSDQLSGSKSYLDYSYKLPTGQTNDEFHLLIYVYDVDTYEVLQVIKQEI